MDQVDHPEINTSELTSEVRKAMARQLLKNRNPDTDASATKGMSSVASPGISDEDNFTGIAPVSTDLNFAQLKDLPTSPRPRRVFVFEPNSSNKYHVNDLLKFHDADFLTAAYRAVLKREPDRFGYEYYLEQLREGHLDKVDLLTILRSSPEGRSAKTRIEGLASRTFLRRISSWPILGYPLRLGIGLLRQPVLITRVRQHEGYAFAQNRRIEDHEREIAEHIDVVNAALTQSLSRLSTGVSDLLNRSNLQADLHEDLLKKSDLQAVRHEHLARLLVEQQQVLDTLRQELAAQTGQLRTQTDELRELFIGELAKARNDSQRLNDKFGKAIVSSANETRAKLDELQSSIQQKIARVESSTNDLTLVTHKLESSNKASQAEIEKVYERVQRIRTDLTLQGNRMSLILEEARTRLPAPFDEGQLKTLAAEERHKLDVHYAELEDNFRGSQNEIKKRLAAYLPHIKSLVTPGDTTIVDLGCGRGEWLELLKEEGYRALGVDTNRVLLDRCRQRGLDVIQSDVLTYLRALPDNSVSSITGFHIIEHLRIDDLMSLLDEVVRTLRPGGVVIFETPNPDNVLVGSNYFYFDPTHRNPLPSLLMKFLLESRGLHRIEVMDLHDWAGAMIAGDDDLTTRFNKLFYGPMDYAITGWKVPE